MRKAQRVPSLRRALAEARKACHVSACYSVNSERDEQCMRLALLEAGRAEEHGDVPVGALLVDEGGGELVRAHNERELTGDPTAHAEILALRRAAQKLGRWNLSGTTLFVTLEPCPMCAGALVNARVARVVYGARDEKAGAMGSLFTIGSDPRLNHRIEVTKGVLEGESGAMLSRFFAQLRRSTRSS